MSAILESLNAFAAAGMTAVLNTLWLALAVAAVIWFALRLMPRVNAATRHAVWWAVLALIVLMPLIWFLPRLALPVASSAWPEKQSRTRVLPSSRVEPHLVAGAHAPALPLTSGPVDAPDTGAAAPHLHIPIEFHP